MSCFSLLYYAEGKAFLILCTVVRMLEGCGTAMFKVAAATIILQLTPKRYSGKILVCIVAVIARTVKPRPLRFFCQIDRFPHDQNRITISKLI